MLLKGQPAVEPKAKRQCEEQYAARPGETAGWVLLLALALSFGFDGCCVTGNARIR